MELKGQITKVFEEQNGTSRAGVAWRKQEYLLKTYGNYPKDVYFYVFGGDRIDANRAQVDDKVIVSFDVESREFGGRWYTDVSAWRIVKDEQAGQEEPQPVEQPTPEDGMPF